MHSRPLRAGFAGLVLVSSSLLAIPVSPAAARGYPAWYRAPHRTSVGAVMVARRLAAGLPAAAGPNTAAVPCRAEPSRVNVQVNCRAEDGTSSQNTQSETSVAVAGQKVVVGYNDSFICCTPVQFNGYSVSHDGGATFTDMGTPTDLNAQTSGDPSVAVDNGTFYMSSLALNKKGDSLIAVWVMPKGTDKFKLLSVPVNVGSANVNFADEPYLAIGRDGAGLTHFYISWVSFTSAVPFPIKLSDSTDGVQWRTTQVAESSACSQASTPLPAGGTLYVSYEQYQPVACVAGSSNPAANEIMAVVDVATHKILRRTVIAPIAGSGDSVVACNSSQNLIEVIETAPGHDMRTFELPSITRGPNGFLYAIWEDRPHGLGGGPSNSTNVYLSYSKDGDQTWSAPQRISGPISAIHELDRVQPWLSSDARGLHAMWYQRVPGPSQDLIQTDTEDLTFATDSRPPMSLGGEKQISPPAPIAQTNPNQDPAFSNCYFGDYNNILSTGTVSYVTWADDRNPSRAPDQPNQPDVFLQKY